jgi:hypothetical protein
MSIQYVKRAFPAFPLARIAIDFSKMGWLLIAITAVIAADSLLAAAAWYAVGFIIGN